MCISSLNQKLKKWFKDNRIKAIADYCRLFDNTYGSLYNQNTQLDMIKTTYGNLFGAWSFFTIKILILKAAHASSVKTHSHYIILQNQILKDVNVHNWLLLFTQIQVCRGEFKQGLGNIELITFNLVSFN